MIRRSLTVVAGTDVDASMARYMAISPSLRSQLEALLPTLRGSLAQAQMVLAKTEERTNIELELQDICARLQDTLKLTEDVLGGER